MGTYEEKQAKEREALDAQFKALAAPLAERLLQEIEKATGVKPKKSVEDGSHRINLWISDPSISISVEHDWGSGHHHYSRLPLGKPKIGLNTGRYNYGKSWYRPGKDGSFNIEKIIHHVSETVANHKRNQEYTRQAEIKKHENEIAQAKELKGVEIPEGAVVTRNHDSESYSFKFGGTFSGLTAKDVAALSESFKKLAAQYNFEKSWRTDF